MNNQFSQRVSDIITYSKEEANRLRNRYIGPEHLLLGMLRDGGGKAIEILMKLDIDLKQVKKRIESFLRDAEDDTLLPDADVPLSPMAAKILKMCILEARILKSATADAEHVLLAILKDGDNLAATVLEENRVNYQTVFEQLTMQSTNPNAGMGFPEEEEEDDEDMNMSHPSRNAGQGAASSAQTASKKSSNDTPVLDNFGTDMTRAAEEGKLDPVVGREREIERLAQILSRRKKNNPVLIGEPGVGKSAIVEGLALRIVQKKVSRILFDKRVVMLDMASVVAGTKYRGQFEERIRSIINELQKNPNVILFIDEIHTIVGAGAAAGSMDAANMLKPALARGEIQCIGATTLDEYRKNIEKDGALERRFQKVIVEPTTPEETLQILRNIKEKYEDHHNVSYTDEALEACVKLAERYITDRNFPDKAIDALDEAGSRVHLTNINVPKEIEEQEKLIEDARVLKAEAVKSQNFELAASYRDREKELSARLDEMKEEWEARLKDDRQLVGEEEIANVISMMSGIPVQRMAQAEGLKLAGMKEDLQAKVVAQDAAIEKLTKAILRSRVGLKDPNHPIGTFMFLGPTGVGKTHLAKQLAKYMFGSADALIRIDMSEYMEKYTVSRMIGAAPGYVGYEEGGQLTEKVRRKPFSVVLFDEIEKAHPDIFNTLLQVLDDGHLTDGQGRKVDFKNTIIILTTNLGTRDIAKAANTGFNLGTNTESSYQRMKEQVSSELKQQFRPDIIVFKQLTEPQVRQIVDLDVKQLNDRLFDRHMSLELTDAAKDLLAQKGFDPLLGARPLRRVIQRDIEDAISEKILMGDLEDGQRVKVDAEGEGILGEFTFTGEAFEEPSQTDNPVKATETAAETDAATEPTASTEPADSAQSQN